MNSAIAKLCFGLILLASHSLANAAVITLPENELPSESVIPKLDNRTVVLKRTIQKTNRLSAGISIGSLLDEMFYNGQLMSIDVRYNTGEMSAWGLRWDQWAGGPTSYTETFANSTGELQFQTAPARQSGFFLTRTFDLYYGKISMGKEVVTPMHFSWLAMVGAQNYEMAWLPAVQGGGQLRVYFTKEMAFDLQYIFSAYQKVDPTSTSVRKADGTPPQTAFTRKLSFGQIVQVGFSYLF